MGCEGGGVCEHFIIFKLNCLNNTKENFRPHIVILAFDQYKDVVIYVHTPRSSNSTIQYKKEYILICRHRLKPQYRVGHREVLFV